MKKLILSSFIATAAALLPAMVFAADGKPLAQEVWRASGGENWGNVQTIDFTFAVVKNGKTVASAAHHWNVPAQTDEVKWKGKDVTVNLADPGTGDDAKAAYARWVNDSYWLLAPLKLKDKGVTVEADGTKEINGAKREVLKLSFAQVGLTPNDQYRLYIDPESKLVTYWDYIPKGDKGMSGTWKDYRKTGGLTLSTNHKMHNGVQIRFENLKVTDK
jgi:hypothetical protein